MSAYAPIEVGVEAYIVRDGQLLLGKRKNVYGAGTWGLPGGHIEFMERSEDAIMRELLEELGVTIRPEHLALLAVTDDPRPEIQAHHLHLTFQVDIGEQAPSLCEPHACEEWRWFTLDNLPEPLFLPHARIFANINSGRTLRDLTPRQPLRD